MMIGEPVLGPLTVPDITLITIGVLLAVIYFINKMKPPRPPFVVAIESGLRLHNEMVNDILRLFARKTYL